MRFWLLYTRYMAKNVYFRRAKIRSKGSGARLCEPSGVSSESVKLPKPQKRDSALTSDFKL